MKFESNTISMFETKPGYNILQPHSKKSYGTLSKGAIFLANPVYIYILRKYEHNNNKSKHGTFNKSKIREVAENGRRKDTKSKKGNEPPRRVLTLLKGFIGR